MSPSQNPSLPASPELPESVSQAVQSALDKFGIEDGSRRLHAECVAEVCAAITPLWPSAPAASPVADLTPPETDEDKRAETMAAFEFSQLSKEEAKRRFVKQRRNIYWYIGELASARAEVDALRVEYESRAAWIAKMNAILGYDNTDGFHSKPDPFEIASSLRAQLATAKEEASQRFMDYAETRDVVAEELDLPLTPKKPEEVRDAIRNVITSLRSDLAKANAAVEENREAANKWKEYYRAAYGHPWESRNRNYQGL